MKLVLNKLASLQDLLLIGTDKIYRFGKLYYTAQLAIEIAVLQIAEHRPKLKKFVTLGPNLSILTSDEPKHGYIPIIDVTGIEEYDSLKALAGLGNTLS